MNVLFLCTHNAMRSIVAESLLRSIGKGRFQAFSAGCEAAPAIHEEVLSFLHDRHLPIDDLKSKSWLQFAQPQAPEFAFVIALSERAAGLARTHTWPGDPVVARWTLEEVDEGEEDERSDWALRDAFWLLSRRIKIFASLPHEKTTRHALQNRLKALEAWQ